MKKKKIKRVTVLVVLVAALVAGYTIHTHKKNNVLKYKTEKVTRGDIVEAIIANGTVNAVTTVSVGTQVSGTIKEIYVDYNSPVRKNQILAQIDPSVLQAQYDQQKANLAAAKANVARMEAQLLDAKRTMERNRELYSKGFIARSEKETAETNYEAALAQLNAAKAQVVQTEAAVNYAATNLRYTRILSPVNGIVISRNVDVGQTVAASFQTPTLFLIAQDLTKMQIDTNVDEADIGKVKVGQNVEFTVDAYPDKTFSGTVFQVRNAPTVTQNVVTYDVVVKVSNPDFLLKPGMTANVSIISNSRENVLKIPNAALRFKPGFPEKSRKQAVDQGRNRTKEEMKGGKSRGPSIWILKNGKPQQVEVVTGISDGAYTEIVSGQIKEGDEVIIEAISNKANTQTPRQPQGPRFF